MSTNVIRCLLLCFHYKWITWNYLLFLTPTNNETTLIVNQQFNNTMSNFVKKLKSMASFLKVPTIPEIIVMPLPTPPSLQQKLMDLIDDITEEVDLMPNSYRTSTTSLTTFLQQVVDNQNSDTLLPWYIFLPETWAPSNQAKVSQHENLCNHCGSVTWHL